MLTNTSRVYDDGVLRSVSAVIVVKVPFADLISSKSGFLQHGRLLNMQDRKWHTLHTRHRAILNHEQWEVRFGIPGIYTPTLVFAPSIWHGSVCVDAPRRLVALCRGIRRSSLDDDSGWVRSGRPRGDRCCLAQRRQRRRAYRGRTRNVALWVPETCCSNHGVSEACFTVSYD